ncbi:MAG: M15 family metallopeptidase, partial [Acidimicrobiia bacterium]|nr:M15 family metallopeptidase [Acidimicrobiia bacterium]
MAPRSLVVSLVALSLVVLGTPSVMALSSTSGDVGPNFNESRGCGEAGPNSPYVGRTGVLPSSTRVYGPKADFFGRSRSQLLASMLNTGGTQWLLPPEDRQPRLHQRLLPALNQARQNLIDGAVANGGAYPVHDLSDWVFRTVGGREYLSNHAMGSALDINPAQNPYRTDNTLITNMPEWFRDAWRAAGFCWGGDWVEVKDTMHYSWMGPLATDGYGPRVGPYAPLTVQANFGAPHVDVAIPYAEGVMAMAD